MFKKKKKEEAASEDATEATEATKEEKTEGAEGEVIDGDAAPKKGKKKLVIIAGAVVLLLAIGAGLFFSGVLGGSKKTDEAATEEGHGDKKEEVKLDEHGKPIPLQNGPVYYELPQFLVNLNSPTGRVSFLKMSVTIELKDQESVLKMDASKPRIMDTFNTYLRELRPADIQGSAGIYRLRNELLTRLNSTIEEGIAKDVLFGEIIVQ
jgi:flagellar protein FliL